MRYKLIKEGEHDVTGNMPGDLYNYTVYTGRHQIQVGPRDSCWFIDVDTYDWAVRTVVGELVESTTLAVVIYGYTPFDRITQINKLTTLPYVNGCSTTELLPPIRKGDPTFQLLYIPEHAAEQAHHIHSTARIVYVHEGKGTSVIGMEQKQERIPLNPGDVLILDKMVPHHFETTDDSLVVLPLHIFSSTGQQEFDHPMFNGTHLT